MGELNRLNAPQLMARFNAWVNERLYGVIAGLTGEQYRADRGLYFGSSLHTLNHLLVVDRLWCGRVRGEDHGAMRLDDILYDDFAALRQAREDEDRRIIALVDGLDAESLRETVRYRAILGEGTERMRREHILLGMFNHQTHHRGQLTAALSTMGVAYPALDLVFYLEDRHSL